MPTISTSRFNGEPRRLRLRARLDTWARQAADGPAMPPESVGAPAPGGPCHPPTRKAWSPCARAGLAITVALDALPAAFPATAAIAAVTICRNDPRGVSFTRLLVAGQVG